MTVKSLEEIDIKNYDFLDFGCSVGMSLAFGVKYLNGHNGIGIDIDEKKIRIANENLKHTDKFNGNHTAVCFDVLNADKYDQFENKFRFTSCIHFLEHLNSNRDVEVAIRCAVKFSRDFVYIIQPNMDQDILLFKNGFKTYFSDWSGHTNLVTSYEFFKILNKIKEEKLIGDYIIFNNKKIENSNSPIIHPLNSPEDQHEYNKNIHPPKKMNVKFNGVYEEIGVFIIKKENFDADIYLKKISTDYKIIYDSRKE